MRLVQAAFCGALAFLSLGLATHAAAADLLAPGMPAENVIDTYVDAHLKKNKVAAVKQAEDGNVVRRVTLDLIGRVPTPGEIQAYVDSRDVKKREQLVDQLLDSPEFVDHQVNEFDWMIMQGSGSLREYLTLAFREKRSWDRMFRDLLLSDAKAEESKQAVDFIKTRTRDLDRMTNDVSSVFFGVNISCAQCHDHPLAPDWKQDHFYGLKSFLSRTYENGGFVGERDYGLVTYLTPKGEQRQAKLMYLTGKLIDEPQASEPDNQAKKKEQELLKSLADKKQAPPKPSFSRRAKLVETALASDQRSFFARSIVNRVWYRLIGHGLVMPIDQMHSGNPPTHPELLAWLARDLADHDFDLRRLIRGVVLSQTYSRSSFWDSGRRPDGSLFAVAQVRPLTPHQFGASLKIVTADPESWKQAKTPEEASRRAASLASSGRGWANQFQPVTDNFQVGVGESLMFANDAKVVSEFLADGNDRLVGRMKQLAENDEQVDCAVKAVLGRDAAKEEQQALVAYLSKRQDRSVVALQQVVWSLLASSEFRFNY